MYVKQNVTYLGSAALRHHGHRHDDILGTNTHKTSLMNGDDTLILNRIPRKSIVKKNMWKLCQLLHVAAVARLLLSRNEQHKFLQYVENYLPNYTASLSKRQYTSLRRAAHNPRLKMKQMVHVACKSKVVDGYGLFSKL